jgi:hypothetical protein
MCCRFAECLLVDDLNIVLCVAVGWLDWGSGDGGRFDASRGVSVVR